jgi:phosphatidylglycerophosphate synthase
MLLGVKKFSEKLLQPLARKIQRIPANYFTIAGMLSTIFVFFGFLFRFTILFVIFLFITEFLDQLDGVVARLQGPTVLGAFLDSTLDRIGDFFLFSGLIFGGYTSVEIGLIALAGAFLTSYTRAKIEALGVDNLYGVGLLERTDRVPILFIGAIIQIWIPTALMWTTLFLAIGSTITVIQRIRFAYLKFKTNKVE